MTCPHCNREFQPTWTYKFHRPSAKLTCPHCSNSSIIYLSPIAAIAAVWMVLGLLAVIATGLGLLLEVFPPGFAVAFPSLILLYPFCKLADFKFGKLKPDGELQPPAIVACAECKSEFKLAEMVAHNGIFYCAKCKPILLQKLAEGFKIGTLAPYESPFRTRWFWLSILLMALLLFVFIYVSDRL